MVKFIDLDLDLDLYRMNDNTFSLNLLDLLQSLLAKLKFKVKLELDYLSQIVFLFQSYS